MANNSTPDNKNARRVAADERPLSEDGNDLRAARAGATNLCFIMSTPISECGWFKSTRAKGRNRPVIECLEEIRSSRWQDITRRIREAPDERAQKNLKGTLTAAMFSATTRTGGHKESDLVSHTGLLQCDIDHLESLDAAMALRERLRGDPHAFTAWVSPRGHGVKCLLRVPADLDRHRTAFKAAQAWFTAKHEIEIDPLCSAPCQLCFISHDPDLWINPNATALALAEAVEGTPKSNVLAPKVTSSKHTHSAACLPSASANCILHNKVFEEFPSLMPFYRNLVQTRFPEVPPGLRNAALCEIVPLLYSAIDEKFILPFAAEFYRQCRKQAPDLLSAHLTEAKSLLRGVSQDYAIKQLSDDERLAYKVCPDETHRCAFRICHALAASESEQCEPPLFFMSAEKLGHRLGCLTMQAWRILRRLEDTHVIKTVEKGQRRAPGSVAKATLYRWMLASKIVYPAPR